jgi:hypothetical protein
MRVWPKVDDRKITSSVLKNLRVAVDRTALVIRSESACASVDMTATHAMT